MVNGFDNKLILGSRNYLRRLFPDASSGDPTMMIDRNFADVGDFIYANCTSQPSYPATNISWFLNGKKVIFLNTFSFLKK